MLASLSCLASKICFSIILSEFVNLSFNFVLDLSSLVIQQVYYIFQLIHLSELKQTNCSKVQELIVSMTFLHELSLPPSLSLLSVSDK